jgi:uncharacterized protein YjiS (DUF1127 family)
MMARLTQFERDQIAAARARGPHPDGPRPSESRGRVDLTSLSAADLRRRAEIARGEVLADGLSRVRAWAGRKFHELAPALIRKRLEWRTRRELEALSDALLRDIGISRGEIRARARAHAESAVPRSERRPAASPQRLAWPYVRLP